MARYFPNIAGTTLLGEKTNTTDLFKGKTTLVAITSTRLSEEHTQSFVAPVLEDQRGNDSFSFVEVRRCVDRAGLISGPCSVDHKGDMDSYSQINHQANALKAAMVSFFASSLKRQTPEEQWGKTLLARGEWDELDVSGIGSHR
jgi:ATPase complex subunit ATP10